MRKGFSKFSRKTVTNFQNFESSYMRGEKIFENPSKIAELFWSLGVYIYERKISQNEDGAI
jgi:hypothetical protein